MHGYLLDQNDARYVERRERVYTFLKQPVEIEKVKYTSSVSDKDHSEVSKNNY